MLNSVDYHSEFAILDNLVVSGAIFAFLDVRFTHVCQLEPTYDLQC